MKQSCTSQSRLQTLPGGQNDISCLSNDVLHNVLGCFLSDSRCVDGKTLRSVALVSRKWRAVAYSSSLWSIPTQLQCPPMARRESSINASLEIRDSSKDTITRESLMGFVHVRQLTENAESGTSRFLVREKATGKDCVLSLTTKKREKSSHFIREIFHGHQLLQGRFLKSCSDLEHGEYHRIPRGILMYENRVLRWYLQQSNACPGTPSTTQTHAQTMLEQQKDQTDISSSISRLLNSQEEAGRLNPARRHVSVDSWATILDWVAEVAECFALDDSVIFLAMAYFDRVVSTSELSVKKHYYQLVAGACLWIASKTRTPISCKDICMCADNSFVAYELIHTEEYVLKQLEWKLAFPTPHGFLEAFGRADGLDKQCKSRYGMRYISELALQSQIYLSYQPSMIAASSLVLARFCSQEDELWSEELQHLTNYSFQDLSECTVEMSRRLYDIRSNFPDLIMIERRYQKASKGFASLNSVPSLSSFATLTAYQQSHATS